jgi:hypothetical protein
MTSQEECEWKFSFKEDDLGEREMRRRKNRGMEENIPRKNESWSESTRRRERKKREREKEGRWEWGMFRRQGFYWCRTCGDGWKQDQFGPKIADRRWIAAFGRVSLL